MWRAVTRETSCSFHVRCCFKNGVKMSCPLEKHAERCWHASTRPCTFFFWPGDEHNLFKKLCCFSMLRVCQKITQLAPLEIPLEVMRKPHGLSADSVNKQEADCSCACSSPVESGSRCCGFELGSAGEPRVCSMEFCTAFHMASWQPYQSLPQD